MKVSRQNRGVLFLDATTYTQSRIVGKAPFTRIRPICLDSGGTKLVEGVLLCLKNEKRILIGGVERA